MTNRAIATFTIILAGATMITAPAHAVSRDALKAPATQLRLDAGTTSHGVRFERYRQTVDGLPVIGREAVVFDARGTSADGVIDRTGGALASPAPARVSEAQARRAAERAVGARRLRAPTSGAPAILPRGGRGLVVWRMLVAAAEPASSTEVLVDARSGAVVAMRDMRRRATGAARIFDPNPVVQLGSRAGLSDGSDADSPALTGARTSVALERIDAGGCLTGPWVRARLAGTDVCAPGGDFSGVTRSADAFEAAMVYFHIDRAQAYIQSLGFANVMNRQLLVHVNAIPDDNSFYDGLSRDLTFGTGGVDDAEDADVIVHEYGHAIQDDQIPGFGGGGDGDAIGEGWGDYLAATLSGAFSPNHGDFDACVAEWDATAYGPPAPCLRRVDGGLTLGQVSATCGGEPHCVGELWSSVLWTIRGAIGATRTDRIALQSHFALPGAPSFGDASRALLAADRQLYGGRHRDAIIGVLASRGLVDPERLDDAPADATPLAVPGSATGRLDVGAGDQRDTYRLSLTAGQGVIVRLSAPGGELDLRLLRPGAVSIDEAAVAGAAIAGSNELFAYRPAQTGDYTLDVSATSGATTYTIQTLVDAEADGLPDGADNCPGTANADQADADADGLGDACDAFPRDPANDADGDGHGAEADNCPAVANRGQADWDRDGRGDACDTSARVYLDSVRVAKRRLTATGRMRPSDLPFGAFRLVLTRRTCPAARRCHYRQVADVTARTRAANGRLTLVARNLRPGRYHVRAVLRAAGYERARTASRAIRVR